MLLSVVSAFTSNGVSNGFAVSRASSNTELNMVFGKKKTAAQKAEEEAKAAKYWQGEWVCKDCGYIYDRSEWWGLCYYAFFVWEYVMNTYAYLAFY